MSSTEDLNNLAKGKFANGEYEKALELWTSAIENATTEEQRELIYNNRSMCNIKLKRWKDGEADATEALLSNNVDRANAKAWFRRGWCRMELGLFLEAECDIFMAKSLSPADKSIAEKYRQSVNLLNGSKVFSEGKGYFCYQSNNSSNCPIRLRWNKDKNYYIVAANDFHRGTLLVSERPALFVNILLDSVKKEAASSKQSASISENVRVMDGLLQDELDPSATDWDSSIPSTDPEWQLLSQLINIFDGNRKDICRYLADYSLSQQSIKRTELEQPEVLTHFLNLSERKIKMQKVVSPSPDPSTTAPVTRMIPETQGLTTSLLSFMYGILSAHSDWCISASSPTGTPYGFGYYRCLCRINHSCDPNAVIVCDGTARRLIVDRHIKAGDEINVSYRPAWRPFSEEVRAVTLIRQCGFLCSCSICKPLTVESKSASSSSKVSKDEKEIASKKRGVYWKYADFKEDELPPPTQCPTDVLLITMNRLWNSNKYQEVMALWLAIEEAEKKKKERNPLLDCLGKDGSELIPLVTVEKKEQLTLSGLAETDPPLPKSVLAHLAKIAMLAWYKQWFNANTYEATMGQWIHSTYKPTSSDVKTLPPSTPLRHSLAPLFGGKRMLDFSFSSTVLQLPLFTAEDEDTPLQDMCLALFLHSQWYRQATMESFRAERGYPATPLANAADVQELSARRLLCSGRLAFCLSRCPSALNNECKMYPEWASEIEGSMQMCELFSSIKSASSKELARREKVAQTRSKIRDIRTTIEDHRAKKASATEVKKEEEDAKIQKLLTNEELVFTPASSMWCGIEEEVEIISDRDLQVLERQLMDPEERHKIDETWKQSLLSQT
ncbi:putative COMM domain-containing protein [Monocercomonoides exilis]|uniref:putative COMM domain-containing protein n=1 Tax=Monocercomonoides exilis TaxID=2049356 RepID=UPI0035595115|nr:putative COMM domain-containing protein [Monocercomonoides exilis]|eukprot:MONOS_2613.1-p1 / transcript=MONOS_2613.1 / gene=MONOS_2613 / organism=Monocercomonoides_exilis_PA203 / gene_product=COMM domain-containing protein / transcript_product=COMM domain-containing protein / location=Mono_scaffold00055:25408-27927(+) / protein_length=840 / sequence_SO=supercontig / SO=protein_coding / is_pseudo=false